MKLGFQNVLGSIVGGSLLLTLAVPKATPSAPAAPDGGSRRYEVTVQNVTAGQIFSPVLAATHRGDVSLFELGGRSSGELALLAEEGDNSALMLALQRNSHVADVVSANDVLVPGTKVRFTIERDRRSEYFSMAAMLVSTNDAFVGANRLLLPKGRSATRHKLYAYDAGTEFNSESCEFVPGPPCGAAGSHDGRSAEGFIHVHSGVHGTGDLRPSEADWRGPVAIVSIRRLREGGGGDDDDHDDDDDDDDDD